MAIRICLSLLLLLSFAATAQRHSPKKPFAKLIQQVKGDLNKDGLEDIVTVTQDKMAETAPYRLQVSFGQPGGGYKLVVSTDDAIEPQYPDGFGKSFWEVTIESGVLTIKEQLLRGSYEHKFRYQHGNFELIGYNETSSDGLGIASTVDFNLSTGQRLETKERYDTNEVVSNKKRKVLIRPLPRLQDFVPYENELY